MTDNMKKIYDAMERTWAAMDKLGIGLTKEPARVLACQMAQISIEICDMLGCEEMTDLTDPELDAAELEEICGHCTAMAVLATATAERLAVIRVNKAALKEHKGGGLR